MKRLWSLLVCLMLMLGIATSSLSTYETLQAASEPQVTVSTQLDGETLISAGSSSFEAVTLKTKSKKKKSTKKKKSSKKKKSTKKKSTKKKSSKSSTVYVTPTGKCYHSHKCGKGSYSKSTKAKAQSRGLKPCKKCY